MTDVYTTTTHHSWGQRLSSSIKNVAGGFLLIVISVWLLVWNEGNSVEAHRSLKEAEGLVINLSTIDSVNPALEGNLVHVSGMAASGSPQVFDAVFDVHPSTRDKTRSIPP